MRRDSGLVRSPRRAPTASTALALVAVLCMAAAATARAQPSPHGPEFQVNGYTTNHQRSPSVAADARGNLVVAWWSNGSSGDDASGYSVQARRYDANGVPAGGQFQVNGYTTSSQGSPSVATDTQGNFVVAWWSNGSNGSDTSGYSVQAQRYDALFRDGFETGDDGRWSATTP